MKGIWRDVLLYCLLYTVISAIYRLGLSRNILYCALLCSTDLYRDERLKLSFERVCVYFRKNGDYIPLSFILGFYVTQVRSANIICTVPASCNAICAPTAVPTGAGIALLRCR